MSVEAELQVPRQQWLNHMDSARSALVTLLATYVYPDPKPVSTAAFVHALGLLGFNEKAIRQALIRIRTSGLLNTVKVGRRSLWELSSTGYQLMDEGMHRLESLNREDRAWDGRMYLVSVDVPQRDRAIRHTITTRLGWAGYASIAPTLWVSTNPAAEQVAQRLMAELELPSFSLVAEHGAIGDIHRVIRDAWDLPGVAVEYRTFIDEFSSMQPRNPDDYFVARAQIGHQWRRFPFIDPGLPREMLPKNWAGVPASKLYRKLRGRWHGPASERWSELNLAADGKI
ncbi:MAG: transcriptional regulator, PaaX family [Pseudonocardiales bacterium]|jgi:phenylacetic acid degradation operon negative regulatory protein|nr:transcriptional regulator, PaaX family [Pseudonocardiales bacterium]